MYKTIIFDVDGTLIDTERAVLGSLQKMLRIDYSKEYEIEALTFALGIPGAVALPRLGIQDIALACEQWNGYMKEFYHLMSIFDGIEDLLIILHGRSIQTGIVTSKTREELKDDFLPFGLMDYLPFAVCADDTQKHKPNPEPLLRFMEIAGADPCKSLYIGDTVYDWQCAKAAGVPFGLALWGAKQIDEIKAEHNFAYPGDIIQWLEK